MRRNTFLFKVSLLRMRTEIEWKKKKNQSVRAGSKHSKSRSPKKGKGK
jgi:hypothetical protein